MVSDVPPCHGLFKGQSEVQTESKTESAHHTTLPSATRTPFANGAP